MYQKLHTQHIKTYYFGCDNNGDNSTFDNNVIRINRAHGVAHRPMMDILSRHFFNAQVLAEDNITNNPYKLTICVDKEFYYSKTTDVNESTNEDTILFFLENMHCPLNGMIVSIYTNDNMNNYIGSEHDYKHVWPFKEDMHWVGDGNYITLHDLEDGLSERRMSRLTKHENYELIKKIDDVSIYPVKRISYKMNEKEMFSLLKHTKFHIAYPGGTYYSAGLINCPTIGLYVDNKVIPVLSKHPNTYKEWIKINRHYSELMNPLTFEGYLTYDFELKKAVIKHQNYLKHTVNNELLCYLKGYMNFDPMNNIKGD